MSLVSTAPQVIKSVSEVKPNSIGHCEEFSVIDVIRKPSMVEGRAKRSVLPPLMVFKGCQLPRVCTIVLYGDTSKQMDKLTRVVDFAIFVAYHMRLEGAFLADELSVASAATAAVAEGWCPPLSHFVTCLSLFCTLFCGFSWCNSVA